MDCAPHSVNGAGYPALSANPGVALDYATPGPKGCHATARAAALTVESPKGVHAMDTTGAGDIFGGSAMSQFLQCNYTITQ